ncbi:unnamed protein product [Zymoseptoria tritici ST99CH_1A5]|uniref:Phenazine biosynthesis protein n=2 Tax=Zymoseptoria tritici TaxID=1047171 RepID=A0A1X7RWU6_ZYMT9|nr:unnamed protein product [Zymoseptoria tritici ST99CH_3D7]SMR56148.1 unnamed protein product [Zymoseptoria tritici ST99CH_3D1]SMY25331.1 unnamed protein product [Zymoseptoria tritici ST99CH_1A5]
MSISLPFTTLDVFTTTRYEGNPLAVVHIPTDPKKQPSSDQLDQIAKEFNLSETIFIYLRDESTDNGNDEVPEWKVRIYTIEGEIPFAGHPTIGAAVHCLTTLHPSASTSGKPLKGRLLAPAGPIDISYDPASGAASANIPHNVHIHSEKPPSLNDIHQLQPSLKDHFNPSTPSDAINLISTVKGMTFFQVEVPDVETLGQVGTLAVRPDAVARMDAAWNVGLVGSYFYTITSPFKAAEDVEHIQVQSRMLLNSFEDPATGSAACGLAAMLALTRGEYRMVDVELVQGVEMGRKSVIGVRVELNQEKNAVERMELRGSAVRVMEGTVEV